MAFEYYIIKGNKKLRCGYTTGSCAALAAKAASKMLLGEKNVDEETIITPKGIAVTADIVDIQRNENYVRCAVKKDGGDDCDATDGINIYVTVKLKKEKNINIDGGKGVGKVTKKGLNQPVGNAAINSAPRNMIADELEKTAEKYNYTGGFDVIIDVPQGEEKAKKTFNSSLGIIGGISILGTSGIVEPQSLQALIDTIEIEMKMLSENNVKDVILTPGNYGENFIDENKMFPYVKKVKISNFVGEALDFSAQYGFKNVLLVMHIGKAVKLAGGIMNTHSRYADCRREIFAAYAALSGAKQKTIEELMKSMTSDACIEILKKSGIYEAVLSRIINSAQEHIITRTAGIYKAGIVMFSNVYGLIGASAQAEEIMHQWNREENK